MAVGLGAGREDVVLQQELAVQIHWIRVGVRRSVGVHLLVVVVVIVDRAAAAVKFEHSRVAGGAQQRLDLGNVRRTEHVLLHVGHLGEAAHFALVHGRADGRRLVAGGATTVVLQIGRRIAAGVHAADDAFVVGVATVATLLVLGTCVLEPHLDGDAG